MLALLCGCASFRGPVTLPEDVVAVRLAPAVTQTLQMVHSRLMDHKKFPDHEWAWCLYGYVQNDTVYVEDMGVTEVGITETGATFQNCEGDGYVGFAHNHVPAMAQLYSGNPNADGCYFSVTDSNTFLKDERAVAMVVTCGQGTIIARGKE